jgi:hypothetical protein
VALPRWAWVSPTASRARRAPQLTLVLGRRLPGALQHLVRVEWPAEVEEPLRSASRPGRR